MTMHDKTPPVPIEIDRSEPPSPQEPTPEPPKLKPRLTVVGRYTYQNPAARFPPQETIVRYHRTAGEDQPISRNVTLKDGAPTVFDLYWIKSVCLVIIQNHGKNEVLLGVLRPDPSPANPSGDWILSVQPGESLPFRPCDVKDWAMLSVGGDSPITVTLIPA